jgi:hypothetical protein
VSTEDDKLAALVKAAPCLLWTGALNRHGYPSGKEHRRAWEEFHGQHLERGVVLRHRCDTPACIEPTHLEPGTHADNRRDCVERGRQAKGTGNGRARLKEEDIRAIRASKLALVDLAWAYGVDRTTIAAIRQGKTWKHVK